MTPEQFRNMENNIRTLAKVGDILHKYDKNLLSIEDNMTLECFYDARYYQEVKRKVQQQMIREGAKLINVYETERLTNACMRASAYIIDRGLMLELLEEVYSRGQTDTLMRRNETTPTHQPL